jgi:hypothetical protein
MLIVVLPMDNVRLTVFVLFSTHSYSVLTRPSTHWSQLLSDDNPRGYNENQMQKISDADTLRRKRGVELHVMRNRMRSEMRLKVPVDDDYGIDRINAMIADINAQYAAMSVNVGTTHDADVASTKYDEDDEEEESDGDNEPSRRYVRYYRQYMPLFVAAVMSTGTSQLVITPTDAELAPALLPNSKFISTTGAAVSPPTTRTALLTRYSPDSVPSRTLLSVRRRRRGCFIREGG